MLGISGRVHINITLVKTVTEQKGVRWFKDESLRGCAAVPLDRDWVSKSSQDTGAQLLLFPSAT